jgi:flagellar hook-associated protein 2
MTAAQMAADATATINGIAITSASNTLTDVVDGLTLNLLKPTTGDVDVTVALDTETVKTKINDFVTAFNDLANFMRTQMAYNAETKVGGPLQGDSSAVGLLRKMRGAINVASTASSEWSNLSDIGIAMKSDGTLALDTAALNKGLANLPELKKFFGASGADTESTGFMRRFKDMADAALGSEGTFQNRDDALKAAQRRNSRSQESLEARLAQTEARMRQQFTALDATMSKLNGLSGYVSQQLKSLNINTQA